MPEIYDEVAVSAVLRAGLIALSWMKTSVWGIWDSGHLSSLLFP